MVHHAVVGFDRHGKAEHRSIEPEVGLVGKYGLEGLPACSERVSILTPFVVGKRITHICMGHPAWYGS